MFVALERVENHSGEIPVGLKNGNAKHIQHYEDRGDSQYGGNDASRRTEQHAVNVKLFRYLAECAHAEFPLTE
jgi:hypothetical protein